MATLTEVVDAVSFIQNVNNIYKSKDMLCIMHYVQCMVTQKTSMQI